MVISRERKTTKNLYTLALCFHKLTKCARARLCPVTRAGKIAGSGVLILLVGAKKSRPWGALKDQHWYTEVHRTTTTGWHVGCRHFSCCSCVRCHSPMLRWRKGKWKITRNSWVSLVRIVESCLSFFDHFQNLSSPNSCIVLMWHNFSNYLYQKMWNTIPFDACWHKKRRKFLQRSSST